MKIAMSGTNGFPTITVRDLTKGYSDLDENGVRGYGGTLNIRPAYQREYIYQGKQRDEVINTVRKGFPLNTMYWAATNDGYELMDGQQRTISICRYVDGDFSVEIDGSPMFFNNLTSERKNQILNYELSIYICDGTENEKLDWFKIINIAGEKLTDQELRNAIYTGPWLADAKRWFSKRGGPAVGTGEDYVVARADRQEYLETAIDWISNGVIEGYMATHQHDQNANELWMYFQNVINWVTLTFTSYRREMKNVPWGPLYNQFGKEKFDTTQLEQEVAHLMQDEDVTKKSGIYDYVLSCNERKLSIRAFTDNMKREAYERQNGICPVCSKSFQFNQMHADHIKPWSKGGRTIAENCKMLCETDNRSKSAA